MKKIKGIIIMLAALTMAAASCQKDETIRYNNATMGNIVNGQFISDQGNMFNIVEQNCSGKLDTMKRAFIICDVLNEAEGASEYNVRLNHISRVLTKDALALTDKNEIEAMQNDPILLSDIWTSGGYLNIYITAPVARANSKVHTINLVLDQSQQTDGVYTFLIRHDAAGEVLMENTNNSNLMLASTYASFPISSIINEDSAKIRIKWKSYMTASQNAISAQSSERSIDRIYNKGSFEHVPSTAIASKSALEIR